MRSTSIIRGLATTAVLTTYTLAQATPEISLPITARTTEVDSDWTSIFYPSQPGSAPKLIGNDGGAASGGFRAFDLTSATPLEEVKHVTPGRTKLVTVVHGVGATSDQPTGKDAILTISMTESLFRLYDPETVEPIGEPIKEVLGDWSALCTWKPTASGETYVYLFGKGQAKQFLLRQLAGAAGFEMVEIQSFKVPVEASACAVSPSFKTVYFATDDGEKVYGFPAAESTQTPKIEIVGEAGDEVTGLATYVGGGNGSDYLLVGVKDAVEVRDTGMKLLGTMKMTGDEDIEIQGLSLYQGSMGGYPAGALAYAIESASGKGFAVSSLEGVFEELGLQKNTAYDPRKETSAPYSPVCDECSKSGFCTGGGLRMRCLGAGKGCECFAGFAGDRCQSFTCAKDCSGHGTCVGANTCQCEAGWGGLNCAFKVVLPLYETDANGGDGDDPAIWIHPTDKELSRVITTTKSEEGAGLAVFDLKGKLLQTMPGAQPNNVDIIYGFPAGDRRIDLAYAACREDDTLCIWEMAQNGTLLEIAGGIQPTTKNKYKVYGSCIYRSPLSGKQYLFVNAKTAEYLQFELTWADDALQTTLVRNFTGGSGGQTEGCVGDNANGSVLIGEEPYGLWRYSAEPEDDVDQGYLIDSIDGGMYADVEGVTLVEGKTKDDGFIIVSQQGVSAYNVYRRKAPHEFVETFTIKENKEKGIDAVTNTDGLAAIGTRLGGDFPYGLAVMHDDANQLPGGGTSDEASFKFVSLEDVLGKNLVQELNADWDPRASL